MSELRRIYRALISVSDKAGIVGFAAELAKYGVEMISTGGTAKALRDAGLEVIDVSDVTGFPEMMDGRVKTLHPKIHGAFLALRDDAKHIASMNDHGIKPIDLVVVNLYPFEQTTAKADVSLTEAVENIDIGGPAMIRSAAKNWRDVTVVTDAGQYSGIIDELNANDGSLSLETRARLAEVAFGRTAKYDLTISAYLAKRSARELGVERGIGIPAEECRPTSSGPIQADTEHFPRDLFLGLRKVSDLRYGENPHQKAALYSHHGGGIANAEQLHGKKMSFNNYVDAEAAWNMVQDFDELAVAIIKHTNPSGLGIGVSNKKAYSRALSTDPVSAFGGIVALNRKLDVESAASVNEVFTEVVVAPDYDDEALELLKAKKNLRVLRIGSNATSKQDECLEYKQISGGFLVQERDSHRITENELQFVTKKRPKRDEIRALLRAWTVCKHVRSNAIVFANQFQTLGVGAGQMNRVDSVRIAAMRAERFELSLKGSVLASDAFFPFRDNVDEAAKYGVSAIIQPGGSVRDQECIDAANEHGIAMVFTGIRHFKH